MVHTFSVDGNYYIYDTGSSALHSCDAKTSEVIKKINKQPYELDCSAQEVAAIEQEIKNLKKNKLLYAREVTTAPKKSKYVKALCLHVCHDCNLRCEYCFAGGGSYGGQSTMMSFDIAKKAVDFLIKNSGDRKILEIDFFGGEPLMNLSVIQKTVYYAKEQAKKLGKTFLFTTTTNGLLLYGEAAKFLNDEMENVVLSLDGTPETHDKIRKTISGKGSYDYVFKNIFDFVQLRGDKSYYVRGTFTARNIKFASDVLHLADSGFKQLSVEPVVLSEDSPLYISLDLAKKANAEYEFLAKEYIARKKDGKAFNFFHFMIDIEGGPCLQKRVSACGAGNEYFSVTPNGDIYPCHQFAGNEKFIMGNVSVGKLDEKLRKQFKKSNLFTRIGCENCFAKFHCSGGCAANNYNFCGDINVPYEITCEMIKKRTECAMHILAATRE